LQSIAELASNLDPPDLCLPSSYNHRPEPLVSGLEFLF
jgi:hypothetical protein